MGKPADMSLGRNSWVAGSRRKQYESDLEPDKPTSISTIKTVKPPGPDPTKVQNLTAHKIGTPAGTTGNTSRTKDKVQTHKDYTTSLNRPVKSTTIHPENPATITSTVSYTQHKKK